MRKLHLKKIMTRDNKHHDAIKSIHIIITNFKFNKVTCKRISYSLKTPIRRKYPIIRRHSGNCKQNYEQCLITLEKRAQFQTRPYTWILDLSFWRSWVRRDWVVCRTSVARAWIIGILFERETENSASIKQVYIWNKVACC